jgi:D-sedoheptulose 7-phosphate isomerase
MTDSLRDTTSFRDTILAEVTASADVIRRIGDDHALLETIEAVAQRCVERLRAGNTILFAGNGGSAADAQHLAAELVNRFGYDRPGLAGLSLTTDTSVLTSISNDYSYERIFARQIETLGRPGDVLIGLSTSGRSVNVVNALRAAREKNITTVGLVGNRPADMGPLCDFLLQMPSPHTPRIQEGHILVGHVICGLIERLMFPR